MSKETILAAVNALPEEIELRVLIGQLIYTEQAATKTTDSYQPAPADEARQLADSWLTQHRPYFS